MEYSLENGQWENSYRFNAIDKNDSNNKFCPIVYGVSSQAKYLPGVSRFDERTPFRVSTRSELACHTSWMTVINRIFFDPSFHHENWYLICEDDVSSSFLVPNSWPFKFIDIIKEAESCGSEIIQMCPINGKTRQFLFSNYYSKNVLLAPKSKIRSHGNGVMLIRGSGIARISIYSPYKVKFLTNKFYFLKHPFNVRPVADKAIYANIPIHRIHVLTFPLFCLESIDSTVHQEHTSLFHASSANKTIDIWKKYGFNDLVEAYLFVKNLSG